MTKKSTQTEDDHDVLAEKERIFNNPSPYRTVGGGLHDEEIGNRKPTLPNLSLNSKRTNGTGIQKREEAALPAVDALSLSELDDDINQIITNRIHHSEAFDMPPSLLSQETSIRDEKHLLANRLKTLQSYTIQTAPNAAVPPSSSSLRRHGSFGTTAPPKPGAPKKEDSFDDGMDRKKSHDDGIDLKRSLRDSMPRNHAKSPSSTDQNLDSKMFAIGGPNSSVVPAGQSVDTLEPVPSMIPLLRQQVRAVPPNSQLLTPMNPMIKVRPEAGEQIPGAYAAAGIAFNETSTSINSDELAEFQDEITDQNSTTPDCVALTPMQSLDRSEAEDPVADPPPLTMDDTEGTILNAERVPAQQNSQEMASSKERKVPCGVCPCWVVLVLVICLTVGIVVTVVVIVIKGEEDSYSSDTTTLSPTLPPCSFQTMILDRCSDNESLFLDVPDCALDRYQELLEVFKPSLQQRGLDFDEITCNINNLAFLGLTFNTKSNDTQFLSDWFSLIVFYLSTECHLNRALPNWLVEGSDPCEDWTGVVCKTNTLLSNVSRVAGLHLADKTLAGTLPADLHQLFPNLEVLSVQSNRIRGTLSRDYANVEYLLLGSNEFSGNFPSFLLQSTTLKVLQLFGSRFNAAGTAMQDLSFTGTQLEYIDLLGIVFKAGPLPLQLFRLTNLISLQLRHTGLSGSIPTEIGLLSNLQSLNFEDNSLTGPIPSELGSLRKLGIPNDSMRFETGKPFLSLAFNELSGTIPSQLGQLTHLKTLNIASNRLHGGMPTEIGNLSSLEEFLFETNKLGGEVPQELCDLVTDGNLGVFGSEDCHHNIVYDQSYGGLRCSTKTICCDCNLL